MSQQEENNSIPANSFHHQNPHLWGLLKPHINQYTKVGYIIFHVYYENNAGKKVPIENAQIIVTKEIHDAYYFSKFVKTNNLGITNAIALPTLYTNTSDDTQANQVYTLYSAIIKAPDMKQQNIHDIPIFDGVTSKKSIQMIQLQKKYIGDKRTD